MYRFVSRSRFALIVRWLRSRFGISAQRVAVRTHLPWHWRALSVAVLTGASLAMAGWIYDAGRQFAGFDKSASESELSALRERTAQLQAELDSVRKVANSSESRLQIESATQERLTAQIKLLEEENTRLKADLAMFENLAGGSVGNTGLAISQLRISPADTDGTYHYRLLLTQARDRKQQEFRGELQLLATVQRGKEAVIMPLPVGNGGSGGLYKINFRYFRRIEGTFNVAAGMRIQRIEARLMQDGVVKASQSIVL
jgi:hypothetical protein